MSKSILTQERLKELFHYDHRTGRFIRLITMAANAKVGDNAGYKCGNGYIYIVIQDRKYKRSWLAWLYTYGELPPHCIDHINHDPLDDRIENLRAVTHKENLRNQSKSKNNTSGYTGVGWHKAAKKFEANIMVNGKSIHLGLFTNIKDAIAARKEAEIKYGFHKNHGK